MDKQVRQDVIAVARLVKMETSYDHRTDYTAINTPTLVEDYITVDELDEIDLMDFNHEAGEGDMLKPAVYWVGSWNIGPLYGSPYEDVVAWINSIERFHG
jgi:hypothetical protein